MSSDKTDLFIRYATNKMMIHLEADIHFFEMYNIYR